MKVKEIIEAYTCPQYETIEIQRSNYKTEYICVGMDNLEKERPDLIDYDIINFVVYPIGEAIDRVRFIVRIDM